MERMKPRCQISFFIPQFKYRNVKFSLPNSVSDNNISNYKKENENFINRAVEAFEKLLKKAKQSNELHFIFTLNPTGFAGITTTQFTSMYETFRAFDDYVDFIFNKNADNLSVRIALALYCHLSEARGFYQIPKNLLRILNGEFYNPRPFDHLIKIHKKTGELISPNANELMKDLIGHSESVGLHDLAMVFKDAFHNNNYSGFCVYDEKYPIIFVNNSMPMSRQIFTLFHELSHLLYHLGGIDFRDNRITNSFERQYLNYEVNCNKFANPL